MPSSSAEGETPLSAFLFCELFSLRLLCRKCGSAFAMPLCRAQTVSCKHSNTTPPLCEPFQRDVEGVAESREAASAVPTREGANNVRTFPRLGAERMERATNGGPYKR